MINFLISFFAIGGSLAILLASVGLIRFPDFFSRTHAATKASAFGIALLLIAVCLTYPQANVIVKSVIALVALFLTLPVGSQALADAARQSRGPEEEK